MKKPSECRAGAIRRRVFREKSRRVPLWDTLSEMEDNDFVYNYISEARYKSNCMGHWTLTLIEQVPHIIFACYCREKYNAIPAAQIDLSMHGGILASVSCYECKHCQDGYQRLFRIARAPDAVLERILKCRAKLVRKQLRYKRR